MNVGDRAQKRAALYPLFSFWEAIGPKTPMYIIDKLYTKFLYYETDAPDSELFELFAEKEIPQDLA